MGTELVNPNQYPPTLNRWLNLNLVDRVKRGRTSLVVPAFSIANTWKGYSEIVGAYDYDCTHNISLLAIASIVPASPNYLLCVSYVNADNTVVRYKLWEGVGELIYTTLPVYANQLIKKKFRLEIWNTNSTPAVQATALTFITSVKAVTDTRYSATVSELVVAGTLCQGQQTTNLGDGVVSSSPSAPTIFWFKQQLFVAPNWTDSVAAIDIVDAVGPNPPAALTTIDNIPSVRYQGTTAATGVVALSPVKQLLLTYFYKEDVGTSFVSVTAGASSFAFSATADGQFIRFTITGAGTYVRVVKNSWYILEYVDAGAGNVTLNVYDAGSLIIQGSVTTAIPTANNVTQVTVIAKGYFTDLFAYSATLNVGGRAATFLYLRDRINSYLMQLPLTWGVCAAPNLNS